MVNDIDIVLPWVNGNNQKWRDKFNQYQHLSNIDTDLNGSERYRSTVKDIEIWIRGVLKYASWVRKIHVIVDEANVVDVPHYISNKINIIKHSDIINKEKLPVFNSNAIEINVDLIPDLSEYFILFNDDCFLIDYVEKNDFFDDNGLPIDVCRMVPINNNTKYGAILSNNAELLFLNRNRSSYIKKFFRERLKNGWSRDYVQSFISLVFYRKNIGWFDEHMPIAYLKSSIKDFYTFHPEIRKNQTSRRFRSTDDYSHLMFRFWRLSNGKYRNRSVGKLGIYCEINNDLDLAFEKAVTDKKKIICINDVRMDVATYQKCSQKAHMLLGKLL